MSAPALAAPGPSASAGAAAVTKSQQTLDGTRIPKNRPPLPPLPKAPSRELPKPDPNDVKALDELLSRFTSDDPGVREDAVREVLEVEPRLLPAIDKRMDQIADEGDRDAMKALLGDTRQKAREQVRKKLRAEGEDEEVDTPDYLNMLVQHAAPQKQSWQHLTRVVAMSRMLAQMNSVEAARELIEVYVRFGEFLRVDTQLQLQKMGGGRAVAALIEARRHRAEKIGRWAERQLDTLGKAIPGEAVNTADYQVLADVLRAYGRIRDPDAARIVISFANSERAQVREAARQAVALMGEVANWQLRDTYETIVGKKPARDWTWERTARELFGEFDRLRLSQVYDLFEEGSLAFEKGDLEKTRTAFDKVLTRSPLFEHRAEMAPAYLAYARFMADKDRELAMQALYKAERIASGSPLETHARSLLLALQGEALLERGVADQTLFRRAVELDTSNQRARDVLARIERGETTSRIEIGRYAPALAIAGIALVGLVFMAIQRRSRARSAALDAPAPISEPVPTQKSEQPPPGDAS
ncbi:MAG TPA: hypothetical protein VK524_32095 [Polyangiaceae bacterium]|nr:hypothetical protein [Polyangiaceae bacterium]